MFFQCRKNNKIRKGKCSLPVYVPLSCKCRERTSLYILKGSLTLEAACVLPMFFLAMLAVMYMIQAVLAADTVFCALHESAKKLAVAAYTMDRLEGETAGEYKELWGSAKSIFSSVYVKNHVVSKIEEESGAHKRIQGGASGIRLTSSSICDEDEMIDLKAVYKLQVSVPLLDLIGIKVTQRAAVRAWTGKEYGEDGRDSGETGGDRVYVTATGSVYHKDRECSHIRLSITQVEKEQTAELRNEDGAKYYPCEDCQTQGISEVYITPTGNRYHGSLSCSGLKRTVTSVTVEEASGYRPCKACGG